jgi:hypothetical protein
MIDETGPNLGKEVKKELRKKKLADLEPIEESHVCPESKADLAHVVEGPLLSACEKLYDKNIQTFMSSANKKDLAIGSVHFIIIYEALSKKNKEIAKQLIAEKKAVLSQTHGFYQDITLAVDIAVTQESTWGEIEDQANAVADRFNTQRLIPEVYSYEFLSNYLSAAIEEDIGGSEAPPEYFEQHGFFYNKQSNVFFKSKEDLRRALMPIAGEDPNESPKFYRKI